MSDEQQGIPSVPVIDRIIELQPARLLEVEGYTHIDKDKTVKLFTPPVPEAIEVSTLSSFATLLDQGVEQYPVDGVVVHVDDYNTVEVKSKVSDRFGRRQVYISAKALTPERQFKFNTYMGQEEFVIALRSMFQQDDERDALIAIAGNIAAKSEVRQEDDGISQTVTMKAGVVRVENETIKPLRVLKPFRTFLEVDQPSGEFIHRVKNIEGSGNQCALFEADAGRWKLTAMDTIASWLRTRLAGSKVDGVGDIPVVS